jgi:hypothetical protein
VNAITPIGAQRVNLRDLSRIAYGNGFTLWHCGTLRVSDATAPGFFADATFTVGDHIHVSALDGGAVLYVGVHGVVPMCATGAPMRIAAE